MSSKPRTQASRQNLYNDPSFPPNNSSLGKNEDNIEWKRPVDIVPNPNFIVDGSCRHDILQGALGNCWLLASAASLAASHPDLFHKVVPHNQTFTGPGYTGKFRFNIWWYGVWTEVIIDDNLPTRNGQLLYCRIDAQNEFWPCLLEKAYAKLNGSYDIIQGGNAGDAMVDLTGGISEKIDFSQNQPPYIYNLLKKSFKMNSLLAAGTNITVSENCGLSGSHVYTITGFEQVKTGNTSVDLIRLRNPWGASEWKGPWGDGSAEMNRLSQDQKDRLLKFKKQDEGEFWMSFGDFRKEFNCVDLGHLQVTNFINELEARKDDQRQQSWKVHCWMMPKCEGVWNQEYCWRTPRIVLDLGPNDKSPHSTMIVSLLVQKRDRRANDVKIGLEVIKDNILKGTNTIDDKALNKSKEPIYRTIHSSNSREITKRYSLTPGTYAILVGSNKPDQITQFILRVYTGSRSDPVKV